MQTIPIKLTPNTVPVGIAYSDINQLLTIIGQYMGAQIQDTVTFVQTGPNDPTQFVTPLFFNTSQGVWKYWDATSGRYLAVTQFLPGDTKTTFIGGDELQQGWVLLDGRKISQVQGLSQNQQQILEAIFGIGGSLPTTSALTSLNGLPLTGSFSGIANPAVTPPTGQIGALPFGSSYDPSQSQALGSNTETLRGSADSTQAALAAALVQAEAMLDALTNSSTSATPLFAKVFAGYP